MPQTHLIFDPGWTLTGSLIASAEFVLTGHLAISPLMTLNGIEYGLYASYTHADQTTENLYRPLPLFNNPTYDSIN
ncbi:MAG: hypothetical protein EOO39_46245 [Cytophagaceae bacterium]|nr:MAG: hypothetical protein EOO39_46245 [Cytophagaceae bacterium]